MSKNFRQRRLATESLESRQLLHGGSLGLFGPPTIDEHVEAVFERYDETGDGVLNADDGLSDRVQDRLADADADGDGSVSTEELTTHLETSRVSSLLGLEGGSSHRRLGGDSANRIEAAIDVVDDDGEDDIDQSEVSSELWEQLAAADTDGDASLTADELTVMVETLQAERQAEAIANRVEAIFSSLDDDGDSLIGESEVSERLWERISSADSDGDSAISEEEMTQFVTDQIAEREASRLIFGGGSRGVGGMRRGGRYR